MGLTDIALRKPESSDSRFRASLLSEPERALVLKEPFGGELIPRIRIFRSLSGQPDLDQFLLSLPAELQPYLPFNYMSLVLRKKGGEEGMWYVLDGRDVSTLASTDSVPSEEPIVSWVMDRQDAAIISDFEREIRFSSANKLFKERNLKSVCAVPLTTTHRQLGAILIGSLESDVYSRDYARFFPVIAD